MAQTWMKADDLTVIANIAKGKPFKMLIPEKFGGGFLKGVYHGDGRFGENNYEMKWDIYELLAFWNDESEAFGGKFVGERLRYLGQKPNIKQIDYTTMFNRNLGKDISDTDAKILSLKYPPKLVSASYKGTYEDCDKASLIDKRGKVSALERR